MLNLITAVPGSGKTLFLLQRVAEQAAKENRQVYYSGIPLTEKGKQKLDWLPLEEPEKWHELPAGAIIVIDECQRVFPPRRTGTHIPKHVSMFETHRHHGFDVWLITQAPRLMDSHIRQLVNKHFHLKRIFGMKTAELLSWDNCEELPNTSGASARCLDKKKFIYPKEVFSWYESAQLHTHKVQIPRKLIYLLVGLVLVFAALFASVYFVKSIGRSGDKPPSPAAKEASAVAATAPPPSATPKLTPVDFQETTVPLDPDRPETAPRYDHLSSPKAMPTISGCIKSSTKCTCYTEQATVLSVPPGRCEEVIAKGYFNEYLDPQQSRQEPPRGLQEQESMLSRRPPVAFADESAGYAISVPDTRQKTPNMM